MHLPGKKAKENRSTMVNILVRYFAGDKSLLKDIKANAASDSPVAQMAQASLASERVDSPLKLARKRPLEELEFEEGTASPELAKTQTSHIDGLEMEERKAALELTKTQIETVKTQIETVKAQTESVKTAVVTQKITLYSDLCSGHPHMDERARRIFKDLVLSLHTRADAPGQLQLEDGAPQPLHISKVAFDLGYSFNPSQLMRVGTWIAKAYFKKYNHIPHKHAQLVGGETRMVNTYHEVDRDLLEAEIRRFAKEENIAARV